MKSKKISIKKTSKKSNLAKLIRKTKKKTRGPQCPYDDFACRVYSFCGTTRCMNRGKRLRNEPDEDEDNDPWQ